MRLREFPGIAFLLALAGVSVAVAWPRPSAGGAKSDVAHRSPIALALSADCTRLLTANQTSGSVSLVDTAAGSVLAEVTTGDKPAGVALSKDGKRGVVTHWYG